MVGALSVDDTLSGDDGDLSLDGVAPAAPDYAALSAKLGAPNDIAAGYQAAIDRLKAQRSGLSNREKLATLLIGFGQPTTHGWREGVSNAAGALLKQSQTAQDDDAKRQALIAKYQAEMGSKVNAGQVAMMRAGQAAQKDAQGRVQILPGMYPGASPMAVRTRFDAQGNPVVENVGIGAGGGDPLQSGAPAAATPASPFPIQHVTGADLAAKYSIPGYADSGRYQLHTAGPDAGKVEDEPAEDPLAQYGGATGTELLNQLTPADRAQVELIAKGKIAPPTAGTRGKAAQRVLALAGAAYPGTDFAKNYKTTTDFASSGKAGQNIVKTGTAIDHAARLYDSIDSLGNVDLSKVPMVGGLMAPLTGVVNSIKNKAQSSTNPAVNTYLINRDQYINELGAAIKGSGNATSLAEFRNWQKDMSNADSPEVMKSVVQRGVSLLGDRLQNQVQPYNDTLGTNRSFLSFLPLNVAKQFMRVNPDYQLTDDDKSYLAQQELEKRQKPTAPAGGGTKTATPSSAAGGHALPANLMQQYRTIPFGNKATAKARLAAAGYDVSGLN